MWAFISGLGVRGPQGRLKTLAFKKLWFATVFEFVFAEMGTPCWNLRYAFAWFLIASEGD
jgi:hypothetical protein